MTIIFRASGTRTRGGATRRIVALVMLLCVCAGSVEVLFGNEPATVAQAVAPGAEGAPDVPIPADHHEEAGCPC